MHAGRLDRLIRIERKTVTQAATGQEVETWAALGPSKHAASVRTVRGDERFLAQQFIAREQTEFQVRKFTEIEDLNPLDRIVYPATTATPPTSSIYDILAVHELGRGEGFKIIAARRAEQ
jgi:head-tail adaptor